MTAFRRYRRRRYGRSDTRTLAVIVILGAALASGASRGVTHGAAQVAGTDAAAVQAISFARAQLGKSYLYGATGPDAYDCSGLTQAAWASAGVSIPRTSEEQWAQLPHVSASQLQPGDLVFFVGAPIDPPPGHVVLYIGGGQVIQAYATGYPVMVSSLASMDAGGLVGYARP